MYIVLSSTDKNSTIIESNANFKSERSSCLLDVMLFYSLPTNWNLEGYERILQFFLTLTSQRTINYWRLLIFYSSRFDVCERRHHQCYNKQLLQNLQTGKFLFAKTCPKKSYKGHTLLQCKNKCILQCDEWLNHLAKC